MNTTRQPKVMWRSMAVCGRCWTEREGDRQPVRVIGSAPVSCIVCEEETDEGIFVRVKVEWR